MREPYVAEIRLFSFGFVPRGWTACDGRLLPIDEHSALFSLVGWRYGGDRESTFALPVLAPVANTFTCCIALGGVYPPRTTEEQMDEPYVGEIRMFGGRFAPPGWVVCDGRDLPIGSHAELYDVIGRTYGGAEETFRVPQLGARTDTDVTFIIAAHGIVPARSD